MSRTVPSRTVPGRTVVVRYRTRPEAAEENVRLVENVYAALAKVDPGAFRYTTYRLADGVSFVHVARSDGAGSPLAGLPEFAEFQRELAQRCIEQPTPSEATVVGSYGEQWTGDQWAGEQLAGEQLAGEQLAGER